MRSRFALATVVLAALQIITAVQHVAIAQGIGPGFDCGKAVQPLARLICASPALSRIDLRFNQAYHALYYTLDPDNRRRLQAEDNEFLNDVKLSCGVPDAGPPAGSSDCVAAQYNDKRSEWVSRLEGPAREEAIRPIERQIELQARLQLLGFLPATERVDGVYGAATRAAVASWQRAVGRLQTGFIDDGDAATLSPPAAPPAPAARVATWTAPPLTRPDTLIPSMVTLPRAASERVGAELVWGAVGLLLIGIYILPLIIAIVRGHQSWPAIAVLNVVLGWTFLGWFGSLIWSLTGVWRSAEDRLARDRYIRTVGDFRHAPAPRRTPPARSLYIAAAAGRARWKSCWLLSYHSRSSRRVIPHPGPPLARIDGV